MRHRRTFTAATVMILVVGVLASSRQANAISAFARKYNLACSSCHTAVPYLNSTGRAFKEAGYRMPDEDGEIDPDAQPINKISNWLMFDKPAPIAARINGRPYDDKDNSQEKLDVVHEIEVFAGGNYWKSGSYFVEIEGEDEEGFSTGISGSFGWHPRRDFNIQGGYGSLLHSDPYNSLQDGGHRLTVAHKLPLDFGKSTGSRFRKDAQFVNLYGRAGAAKKFYWLAGYSAGNGNPEGQNPNDFLARIAYDFTPHIMLGALYFDGQREDLNVDLQRVGVDFNLDFNDFHVVGLVMDTEEDFKAQPGTENNTTGYVELFYTKRRDSRPFFVPLVRYDWKELNDGRDQLAAVIAQLSFFAVENARVGLEYYTEVDNAPGKPEIDRITAFVDINF